MSTIRLILGDEAFDIPVVGASNWGEQITLYLRKNSEILASLQGPQDILLTDFNASNGVTNQNIQGLSFDVSSVQQIVVDGIIVRDFNDNTKKVDSFRCEGMFDGTDFYIDTTFSGTDAKVSLNVTSGGQFQYTSEDIENTSNILIRFRAKAIIDIE